MDMTLVMTTKIYMYPTPTPEHTINRHMIAYAYGLQLLN